MRPVATDDSGGYATGLAGHGPGRADLGGVAACERVHRLASGANRVIILFTPVRSEANLQE
jgi:hypothetical protein